MNVVILTEGGKDYGFGHVARCSSMYQAFQYYGISPKFLVNGDESVKSILSDIDVEIRNWIEDSSFISKADIIVIDSYIADLDFYNKLSKDIPLVVYVDDNNRLNYPNGIVVNGTLDVSNMNYSQRENIEYLVGNEFIPLRKDFWDITKLKINDSIEKHRLLAEIFLKEGKKTDAISIYEQLISKDQKNIEYVIALTNIFVESKEYRRARGVLKDFIKKNPSEKNNPRLKSYGVLMKFL